MNIHPRPGGSPPGRTFTYPISLGERERFWAEGEQLKLALNAHDVYDNGVVHLCYGPA